VSQDLLDDLPSLLGVLQTTCADTALSMRLAFDLHVPHTGLEITSTSVVDTADAATPGDLKWSDLEAVADSHVELLRPSPRTRADGELVDLARSSTGSPYEVVLALAAVVREQVAYLPSPCCARLASRPATSAAICTPRRPRRSG
jgi:hypothetical protein